MEKQELEQSPRRAFIQRTAAFAAGSLIIGTGLLAACKQEDKEEEEDKVTPGEDLMQEHGVLNRVLLIYDHLIGQLDTVADFPPEVLLDSATVIRKFIEDYHEKQEEDFVFPRLIKANRLTGTVNILLQQHQAGRRITEQLMVFGKMPAISADTDRQQVKKLLVAFNRMYRPHEAREDTIIFPALRDLVSKHEYDALGEDFEKREHQMFGQDGFELYVAKVQAIEQKIGLYDLQQFTPIP